MRAAMTQLNLSARAYHRILKLSSTIADLAGSEEIQSVHLAEALHLRSSEIDDVCLISFVTSFSVIALLSPCLRHLSDSARIFSAAPFCERKMIGE